MNELAPRETRALVVALVEVAQKAWEAGLVNLQALTADGYSVKFLMGTVTVTFREGGDREPDVVVYAAPIDWPPPR